MKIKICNLREPAKCSRVQNVNDIPFATAKECGNCTYMAIAKIVLEATNDKGENSVR